MKIYDLDAAKLLLDGEQKLWFDLVGVIDETGWTDKRYGRQN